MPMSSLLALAFAMPAQGQVPPFAKIEKNYGVLGQPWDFEVTPNGLYGIVQTIYDDASKGQTHIIRMEEPFELIWSSPDTPTFYGFSRKLAATNSYAIAAVSNQDAGTAVNGPATGQVKIMPLDSTLGMPGYTFNTFYTTDTPVSVLVVPAGGGSAGSSIVRALSEVLHFDLSDTGPSMSWSQYTPRYYSQPNRIMTGNFMSDSVAATHARVIVAGNDAVPGGSGVSINGFVAIHDAQTGAIVDEHGFACDPHTPGCNFTNPPPARDRQHVHDVTVTPDGTRGLVGGWGVVGVYDLDTGAELAAFDDLGAPVHDLPRQGFLNGATNGHTRNSVVASDSYAIVVGHSGTGYFGGGPADPTVWRAFVVNISDPQNIIPGPRLSGTTVPGRAHDLVLTPNKRAAVVSMRAPGTLVFNLVGSSAQANAPAVYPTHVDPLSHANTFNFWINRTVAATDTRAIVIGTAVAGSSVPIGNGVAELVMMDGAPVPSSVKKLDLGSFRPTDVGINNLGDRALVRSIDVSGTVQPGNAVLGKLTAVDIISGQIITEMTSYTSGGPSDPIDLGYAWGVSHLAMGDETAITGGENKVPTYGPGYVQVVNFAPDSSQ